MNILFVLDPLASIKTYKDSSYAMMRALAAKGDVIFTALQGDVFSKDGVISAHTQQITLKDAHDGHDWYTAQEQAVRALHSFDAVLMRKDPPFDLEYLYSTHLLQAAQRQGARVFNSGLALRNHPEKLSILEFPQFTAPTLVTRSAQVLRDFYAQHQDVIFKPLDGMGGTGIFRLKPQDPNVSVIIETLTHLGAQTIMAQKFIPQISTGDKRILLIGGKVVPFALARIPADGETRGNMAAGGKPVAQALSTRDLEIANTLAPILYQRGLLLVGLDVIGDYLTEINVTSPTGFQEITKQTGFDVADMFAQALHDAVQTNASQFMPGAA